MVMEGTVPSSYNGVGSVLALVRDKVEQWRRWCQGGKNRSLWSTVMSQGRKKGQTDSDSEGGEGGEAADGFDMQELKG